VDAIPAGRVVSVERETFPGLVDSGALVVGYVENAYWRDVGTPEALVAASRDLVRGDAPSPAVPREGGEAQVADGAEVAADAVVEDGSVVSAGASVAAGAVVRGSVLMPGASVARGARLEGCVVGPGAEVGEGVTLHGVTVGDGARVAAPVEDGSRVDCDAVVG